MEITEVRIKLVDDSDDRLLAFCSITLDNSFVIRDLKIIQGTNGPFVAMPSRKLTAHCPSCRHKNHLRAGFCNQCGLELKEATSARDSSGRVKLYADIAHPINSECRELVQQRVTEAFEKEKELARQPGYVSRYDDLDDVEAKAKTANATKPIVRKDEAAEKPEPHAPSESESESAGKNDSDDFGAGIL